MGKLFEILAVEPELRSASADAIKEVIGLFKGAPEKLIGTFRTYFPLAEGGEDFADESTERATTVTDELQRVHQAWIDYVDVALQKEITNQSAEAVVQIGKNEFRLPATALLNLEQRLQELRNLYSAIPTLDPAEKWEFDENEQCYVSDKRTTYKTKKIPKAFEAAPATEQHPAQVHVFHEDERVGHWEAVVYSGMLSKSEKRANLQRIDELLRNVKQARQRANDIEVDELEISSILIDYISG